MGKRTGLALAGAAFLILANSLAWACTKQATLIGLTTQSAPPFTAVTVKGQLDTMSSTLDIRWNGINGPKLASVGPADSDSSGNFSIPVVIPKVAPGIYSVVATGPDYGVARAAIEVLPAGAQQRAGSASGARAASGDLWKGLSPLSSPSQSAGMAAERSAASNAIRLGAALLAAGLAGMGVAGVLAVNGRRRAAHREV